MAESDYDIPLDDYGTPYVTIEEMKELLKKQKKQYEELQQDEQTGLYFTDYFAKHGGNMLQSHLLIEQCMEHLDELDWLRITNGYSLHIIPYLQHLWENPLVWVDEIPSELARQFVVTGRVAEEKSSEERNTCMPYDSLAIELQHERTLWFADNLPTRKDVNYHNDEYWTTPSDIPLWNLLLTDPYELFSVKLHNSYEDPYTKETLWPYCNAEHFRFQIEYIRTNRDEQKAAQIVRLLREDWPDIKAIKLFGVDRCTPEQVNEFEQCLFAGMDRNLRKWEAATAPKIDTPKQTKSKQQDRTYITFTRSGITVGHLDMLRQKLIQVGWIAKDTLPDDFYKLFSGKTNSTKIIWTGAVGKGMLLFLFQKMVDQGEIVVPDNHSITTILESHFVDKDGKYISGLNSSKESPKHFPIIKECLNILQLEVDND